MRLELLCEMEIQYRHEEMVGGQVVLLHPYGSSEGSAYGEGDGTARGPRINGQMRWVNHPHHRSDGVFLPDTHGIIRTEDDAILLFSFRGRTVFRSDKGEQLLNVVFEAEDERYTWLNTAFCVLEGVINGGMHARVYMCINELLE